jgi:DNA-binding CsgD family transcriptional regulator
MVIGVGVSARLNTVVQTDRNYLLEEARAAWQCGNFERCADLCEDALADGDVDGRILLLRARALQRLLLWAASAAVLAQTQRSRSETAVHARILDVRAQTKLGNFVVADQALSAVREDARSSPSALVRAEFSMVECVAHLLAGRDAEADACLDRIGPSDGSVYADALMQRGSNALTRGSARGALALYGQAIDAAARSRADDPAAEACAIALYAKLAMELLDVGAIEHARRCAERASVQGYQQRVLWTAVEYATSAVEETDGRPHDAMRSARRAADCAPSAGGRLKCRARRATILQRYGDHLAWDDAMTSMREAYEHLDVADFRSDEEQSLHWVVAEHLALLGDTAGARSVLESRPTQTPATPYARRTPQWDGYTTYVYGIIADIEGDALLARHRYRQAFDAYRTMGYVRRALTVAIRLGALTGATDAFEYVAEHARELGEHSWIRAALAQAAPWRSDAMLASISRAERDVLLLLAKGKSTAQIAELRDRSPQTIRNTISRLYAAFGVDNRQALIKETVRRGLVDGTS